MLVRAAQSRRSTPAAPEGGPVLRVLGPLAVTSKADQQVVVPGRLRRLLAGLLVKANTVATADYLAEVVWGHEQPVHVEAALQTLVSRLRGKLRETGWQSQLATSPPGYLLDLRGGDLDAALFRARVAEGRATARHDPSAGARLIDEGLALWTGRAYGEFADDEFAATEVSALHELRGVALEERAEVALLIGQPEDALRFAEQLIGEQPLREQAFGQVMTALCRTGRQADAARRFSEYQRAIDEELGLEPSAALRDLAQRLLPHHRRPAPGGTAVVVGPRVPAPPAGGSRRFGDPLVGREHDTAAALQEMRTGAGVLTLLGAGGVGKSRVASAVAADLAAEFPGGVCTVDVAPLMGRAAVGKPDPLVRAVVDALQDHPQANGRADLLDHLRQKRMLLVLDNAEHAVDDAAGLVEAITRTCPGVAVLLTSRSPLAIPVEQVHPVLPLALPAPRDDHDAVLGNPAVRLFLHHAAAAAPRFRNAEARISDVAELCRRLDGVPLAIELAAGLMSALTPAEIMTMLPYRFGLMPNAQRFAPQRHQTLHASVEWSYRHLDERDRAIYDRVSVLTPVFTARHAAAVTGLDLFTVVERLDGLVERSLLTVGGTASGETTTYAMLYPQRAYGLARLAVTGAADTARHRARDLARLRRLGRELTPFHPVAPGLLGSPGGVRPPCAAHAREVRCVPALP
ncbi:AfsR/SARP family transcriptional regulator [Actinokineospora sp. 24-640]